MTTTLWILLCAVSFAIGCFVTEIANNKIEKAFCKNLKELREIHEEMNDSDVE